MHEFYFGRRVLEGDGKGQIDKNVRVKICV